MTAAADLRPWLPPVTATGCSYRGRKDEPPLRFPCFFKGTVTVRQVTGNPFVERQVCERHADEMVSSGHFARVAAKRDA